MVILHCLILYLSLLDVVADAAIINVTHDDSQDESLDSAVISYLGPWSHQQEWCVPSSYHTTVANSKQPIQGTWSTSIYVQNSRLDDQPPSVMFRFYGTAVYVSCVLIPHDMLGIDANPDMLFMLDGAVTGRFARQSPKFGNISLATVLTYESLPKGSHTLRIQNGAEDGKQTHNVSVIALDSITYTTEETSTPSLASNSFDNFYQEQRRKQKTHIILAAVMSSLAGVGIIVLSFWFCLRRTQHKPLLPAIFRHRSTSRTVTPYSKASSSLTSLRTPSPQSRHADDDTHSVLSSVPPSYHSRLSTVS
ncbi:hypothetical protein PLEOSDRAFT_1101322 [Pleurotus ostreatus PC15]|uniref:Mid2 domain-containing protein n=1 Tax=Pleurotus ostreatus (strain PC15) TaxID=1137138 RepID=A0A067NTL7_PLEO1|nr:hypothetical protein PLEOSDRAFT_1101322 [Pleurotus ostreatus PC15]